MSPSRVPSFVDQSGFGFKVSLCMKSEVHAAPYLGDLIASGS